MDCLDYQALMSAMLDGELSAEEESALHTHMETCERCRSYYALLQALQGAPEADAPDPPADLTEKIMASVRSAAAQASPMKKKARILGIPSRTLALAAAAAVVLLAGWSGGRFLRAGSAGDAAPAEASQMLSAAAPAAEESPEEPEAPKADVTADSGAPAVNAAAGSVPEENNVMQNASMSLFRADQATEEAVDADQTTEEAFDVLPVPFVLWNGEEKLSEGADCGDLEALAYQADVVFPAPERDPDYTLRDEEGEILWSLWADGDQLLLCRDEDTAASLEAEAVWDVLGVEP